MTRIAKVVTKCGVCGCKSPQGVILSTTSIGSPDLDTRPPKLARSTIYYWVQVCPECGYCAPDISAFIDGIDNLVYSERYQEQRKNPQFPEHANAFLCYSMIQENRKEYSAAGWGCVFAAWVCDDESKEAEARRCRLKAVELLKMAKENNQDFAEERGAEEVLLTDLLRRSGEFEEALKTCEEGLNKNPSDVILRILRYEKKLISKHDTTCHRIDEAK